MRKSAVACVTVSHLSYASRLLSAWLVTTFTVERFIGVFYPLRRSLIISVSHARRVILAETLACLALAGFTPFTIGIVDGRRKGSNQPDCDVLPEMAHIYVVFNVSFVIIGSIVAPVLVIVTLNTAIFRRVRRRASMRSELEGYSSDERHSPRSTHHHTFPLYHHHNHLHHQQQQQEHHHHLQQHQHQHQHQQQEHQHRQQQQEHCYYQQPHQHQHQHQLQYHHQHHQQQQHQHHHQHQQQQHEHHGRQQTGGGRQRDYNVTVLLLVVSTTFVVLNVPYCVSWFALFPYHGELDLATASCATRRLFHSLLSAKYVATVPYCLNYGVNFALYSVCARAFRDQLVRVLSSTPICGRFCRPSTRNQLVLANAAHLQPAANTPRAPRLRHVAGELELREVHRQLGNEQQVRCQCRLPDLS